jgi:2-polyprenyl-3-methyl-5-hydroxy-6-metoxy-1,4-benzoquinol methylase
LKQFLSSFGKRNAPGVDARIGSLENGLRKIESDIQSQKRGLRILDQNIKALGYMQAHELQRSLPTPAQTSAVHFGLSSRATKQIEYEALWFAHWCRELKIPIRFHRKIWEFAFVLPSLHDAGLLREGVRCLGFGCGREPLPSYFAALGMSVTVTDLAPSAVEKLGWAETGQHSQTLESVFHSDLVDRSKFDANVALRHVDMNSIPEDLKEFDFCRSICALEHLGSIKNGLDFIENSMKTIRFEGISIHTAEFNYLRETETIDDVGTVLFLRRHFEEITNRLTANGHKVAPLDFNVGGGFLDHSIDTPPYGSDMHLKLAIEGFASTCFGLAVQKK